MCRIRPEDQVTEQAHETPAEHAELTRSLVCQLRQGDDRAGRLLDSLYRARLLRFSQGYLGNREEARDVVQEVFYRVLASGKVPDCFRAWVYQITRNRCLDLLRTRKRRPCDEELPGDSQLVAKATGNLTRLVRREQQECAARALRSLPLHEGAFVKGIDLEGPIGNDPRIPGTGRPCSGCWPDWCGPGSRRVRGPRPRCSFRWSFCTSVFLLPTADPDQVWPRLLWAEAHLG